jgi:hypothetical protein
MLFQLLKSAKKWVFKVWNMITKGPKNMEWPA